VKSDRATPEQRRLRSPCVVEDLANCFVVRARGGQQLAYVYCEDDPRRRSIVKVLVARPSTPHSGCHRQAARGGPKFANERQDRSGMRQSKNRLSFGYVASGWSLLGDKNRGEAMDVQTLIIWLIVGAIAGWLAGMVVKGGGYGLIGDIIVGIIGALIAGWLLPQIGIVIGGGVIAAIINAFIGAVILLLLLRLIRRAA
jgi:uncharacterized membrane protein YeaQ/YmgE (transglycosylase-associated protein family)